MHGNVSEWCLDTFSFYSADAVTDPFATGGSVRVIRGGDWYAGSSASCRSAYRTTNDPDSYNYNIGFRVALAPVLP